MPVVTAQGTQIWPDVSTVSAAPYNPMAAHGGMAVASPMGDHFGMCAYITICL